MDKLCKTLSDLTLEQFIITAERKPAGAKHGGIYVILALGRLREEELEECLGYRVSLKKQ